MQKVIIIVGPTAIGKSDLAVKIAHDFGGEVISGDSMQIYKNLSIGTAKIKEEEMQGIPHHLIDIKEVNQTYAVSDFQEQGRKLIDEISKRQKIPIVVGGTGLYIESLIYNVSHGGNAESNHAIRKKFQEEADEKGKEHVWQKLKSKDPQAAKNIHMNNVRRVVRALEVIEVTGEKFSDFQNERKNYNILYDTYIIGLDTNRQELYSRINQRVDKMFDQGLVEEANWLFEKVGADSQSAKAIGYKELFPYFEGLETLNQAKEQVKQNSRRYAKRQLTWFKNRTGVNKWYDTVAEPDQRTEIIKDIKEFLWSEAFGRDK